MASAHFPNFRPNRKFDPGVAVTRVEGQGRDRMMICKVVMSVMSQGRPLHNRLLGSVSS